MDITKFGRIRSSGGILVREQGDITLLEHTKPVKLNANLTISETGNDYATELINQALSLIKKRAYFPNILIEGLASRDLDGCIVKNNRGVATLRTDGENLLISIDSIIFKQSKHKAIILQVLIHQLTHIIDRLIIEDFLKDKNFSITDAELASILLYRNVARYNLEPANRDLVLFACHNRDDEVLGMLDYNLSYYKLLHSEDFFNIGNDQRPIWINILRDFIILHSMKMGLYPKEYAEQVLIFSFEDFLLVRRTYEDYLRNWLIETDVRKDPASNIEFVFDCSVDRNRRSGFMGIFKYREFLIETIKKTYSHFKKTNKNIYKSICKLDIKKDIIKVYVRFLDEGFWKKGYYLMVIPRIETGIDFPIEFVIDLYNDSNDQVLPSQIFQKRELFWQERINNHEDNLVPRIGYVRIKDPIFDQADTFFTNNIEKIPFISVQYGGSNLKQLMMSQMISEFGKRRLLRFALSKCLRLHYRMGGFFTLGDPKLDNICSMGWKIRVVDIGEIIGGLDKSFMSFLHPSHMLAYAMYWWWTPTDFRIYENRKPLKENWPEIQMRWEKADTDNHFRPSAELEFLSGLGIPTDTIIKELSNDRIVKIIETLFTYNGPITDKVLILLKTIESRFTTYYYGDPVENKLDSDDHFLQMLIKIRHEAYDKSYLFNGVIDLFTRSSNEKISLEKKFIKGRELLEEMVENRYGNFSPNSLKAIKDYLKNGIKNYRYPDKESTRPPINSTNWHEINERWQVVKGNWKRSKKVFHRDMDMTVFSVFSHCYFLEDKKFSELNKMETLKLLQGIKASYFTPGGYLLSLLRMIQEEYSTGHLPEIIKSKRAYNGFINSIISAVKNSQN